MDAGRAIVEILHAENVKCVFGLPGGHVLHIYDGLYAHPEIRHVLVRHEQAAASLAAAYAQLTGEVGVCLVTAGPGATNLLSGIAEAFIGSLPIVILAGRAPTGEAFRGANQEVDTDLIFAPVTKWTVRVDRADLVPSIIRQAFKIARSGKPGPVYVDLPPDILGQEISFEHYVPVGPRPRPRGDAVQIAAAAGLLAQAKRPIIIAGGGSIAANASDLIVELAERLGAPVLTSLSGRGSIPDSHPLSLGGLGAHRNDLSARLLKEADVILGLGCKFEQMETNWTPAFLPSAECRLIQVDIDPEEIGRSLTPASSVVGDIREVVADLLAVLGDRFPRPSARDLASSPNVRAWLDEVASMEVEADALAASLERPIHPMRAIRAARKVFPPETTVAFDVGAMAQHMAGGFPIFRTNGPRSVISPSSYYGMGFCAMALPAARIAHPDRPAVCFVGDGSFQMAANILMVALEHKLPVTWIILNDLALGSIRDVQEFIFGNRVIGTDLLVQPDFAAIARACGCFGEQVSDPALVEAAMQRALDANNAGQPAVLDILVARERCKATNEFFPLPR